MPLRAARSLLLIVLSACLLSSGCESRSTAGKGSGGDIDAQGDGTSLTPVTLQLNWFPEAEHGGYYAALVHGYYRDAGLNVEIMPGGPDSPVVQLVARRKADFGVVNADNILFGRAQQAPIVALMAPLQISPRCIIVHESSGIRDFQGLRDMTIAMSPSNAYTYFLRRKLPLENVQVVPYTGNVAQFLVDRNFAQQGYVFSEPFVARKQGGDPHVLMVSDLGFNPYSSVLITNDELAKANPQLVRKMVAASVRGWQTYLAEPDKTNAYVHRVNPQMDLDILAYGAQTLAPLVLDPVAEQQGLGTMSRQRWQQLADQLIETEQLKPGRVDINQVFSTQFLPAPAAAKPE